MQSLDVQAQNPAMQVGQKQAMNGKTGAETARNGSSFLAMIEKMIAGTREGKVDALKASALKATGRGAGDALIVPGDKNTLIKSGTGKTAKTVGQSIHGHEASLHDPRLKKAREDKERLSTHAGGTHALQPATVAAGTAERLLKDAENVKKDGLENASEAKASGKKNSVSAGDKNDAAVLLAMAGQMNAQNGHQSAPVKKEAADVADAGGTKIGKTERKDKKTLINVRDERTDPSIDGLKDNSLVKSVQVNKDGSADMTIGFRTDGTGARSLSDSGSRLTEAQADQKGQSFASMLSSELRDNAADFVKTGSIVLRDNNAGMIRLTLHPESLGNVKISLEMSSDKKITGKIIVSSKEAYDAFNENLDGLSDAFVQGGFESAGFDLSWSGQDSAGYGEKEKAGIVSSPFYASSIPDVMSATDPADRNRGGYGYSGQAAINVFA